MTKLETVDKLIDCFRKVGIKNIIIDNPFKGGQISKKTHNDTGIECVQLEINYNYRSIRKIRNLNKICKALVSFIRS